MSSKQVRYEQWLTRVQRNEDKAILNSAPRLLQQMTDIIQNANLEPVADHPNWINKTLPRFREIYKQIKAAHRDDNPREVKRLADDFAMTMNGWWKLLPWRVELGITMVNESRKYDSKGRRIDRLDFRVQQREQSVEV